MTWAFALRILSALWNVAGILLLAVLFIEFGVSGLQRLSRRLRYGRAGKPNLGAVAEAYDGAPWAPLCIAEWEKSYHLDWAPFVNWRHRPYRGSTLNIDAQGRRVIPGTAAEGEDAIRVHCFGGSTIFGQGARDQGTIPALLQRELGKAGYRVALVNQGQCGYVSTQELIALQQLLKHGVRPHVAVFYDGVNDMYTAEKTGRPDAMMGEEILAAEFALLSKERRGDLARAALAAAMPRTLRLLRQWVGLDLPASAPRPSPVRLTEEAIAPLARAVMDAYAANVRAVRLLAQVHGFRAVFVWQPMLPTKKVKSRDEERWEGTGSRDVALRRRLSAALASEFRRHPDLAGAEDAVDLSGLFDDEAAPVYVDYCHLTEAGNAVVSAAMLPAVEAAVQAAAARNMPAPR